MALVLDFRRRDTAIGLPPREALRARLTQEIEERIALLDALDGDPDFEPDGVDEPSLGWTKTMALADRRDLEEGVVSVEVDALGKMQPDQRVGCRNTPKTGKSHHPRSNGVSAPPIPTLHPLKDVSS